MAHAAEIDGSYVTSVAASEPKGQPMVQGGKDGHISRMTVPMPIIFFCRVCGISTNTVMGISECVIWRDLLDNLMSFSL